MEMHESISFALLARSCRRCIVQRHSVDDRYTRFACVKGKKNRLACRSMRKRIGPRTVRTILLMALVERERVRNAHFCKNLADCNHHRGKGKEKEIEK